MRRAVLDLLQCPLSGGRLDVEPVESDGDDLVHGVLNSEAGQFPVIAGIPVFRPEAVDLVDLVRRGEFGLAARRAAFGEIAPAGIGRLGPWLSSTDRLRPLGRRLEARHRQVVDNRSRPLVDPASGVRDLFSLAYEQLRLRNPEVFAYNWYRFGLPRHLAALAVVEWAPRQGPVLDVGCGAGHLTWALTGHLGAGTPVVGVDGLYFALYVAKTRIAPAAEFICCELESLPLRDGVAGGIWASDVLHALSRKAQVARELDRVSASSAWGAAVGLAVAGHEHEYRGRPLSLDGYRGLLPAGTTLVADEALTAGYLRRRAASTTEAGGLDEAVTVSALWDPTGSAAEGVAFTDWPHGRGRPGPNPLLVPDGRSATTTRLRLRFPTPAFEREHGDLRRYTPTSAEVADSVAAAARAEASDDRRDRLVDDFVVLGFPDGYQTDPWSGFGPGA